MVRCNIHRLLGHGELLHPRLQLVDIFVSFVGWVLSAVLRLDRIGPTGSKRRLGLGLAWDMAYLDWVWRGRYIFMAIVVVLILRF